MNRSRRIICVMLLVVLFAGGSFAQSLNESLSQLSQSAAVKFIQPGFDPFGIALNGGWLGKAPKAVKTSFDLEFGVVAMGTVMKTSPTSFEMSSTYRFSSDQAQTIANEAGITDATLKTLVVDAITA
ncbi:MAG: hypothetical protein EHM64_15150, partial [Ignavibacteriae bacterium]